MCTLLGLSVAFLVTFLTGDVYTTKCPEPAALGLALLIVTYLPLVKLKL